MPRSPKRGDIKNRVAEMKATRAGERAAAKDTVIEMRQANEAAKYENAEKTPIWKVARACGAPCRGCGKCACGTPKRRRRCCVASLAIFVALGIVGGVGYTQDFWVSAPYVDPTVTTVKLKGFTIDPKFRYLTIDVDVTLDVYNPNFIGGILTKAKMSMWYPDALLVPRVVKDILLSNATLQRDVDVGANAWAKLPLRMNLVNSPLNAAILRNMLTDCAQDNYIDFKFRLYDIEAKIWFLHLAVGDIDFSAKLKCPVG